MSAPPNSKVLARSLPTVLRMLRMAGLPTQYSKRLSRVLLADDEDEATRALKQAYEVAVDNFIDSMRGQVRLTSARYKHKGNENFDPSILIRGVLSTLAVHGEKALLQEVKVVPYSKWGPSLNTDRLRRELQQRAEGTKLDRQKRVNDPALKDMNLHEYMEYLREEGQGKPKKKSDHPSIMDHLDQWEEERQKEDADTENDTRPHAKDPTQEIQDDDIDHEEASEATEEQPHSVNRMEKLLRETAERLKVKYKRIGAVKLEKTIVKSSKARVHTISLMTRGVGFGKVQVLTLGPAVLVRCFYKGETTGHKSRKTFAKGNAKEVNVADAVDSAMKWIAARLNKKV